ncbi:Bicyclomycin resistance protein [compost metagenome]
MQLTISIYIVGLAFGQLLYGPASDALGRMPVLRAGLALYVGASLACAVAPTLPLLLAGRFVQAVAAGSGLVLGRMDAFRKDVSWTGLHALRRRGQRDECPGSGSGGWSNATSRGPGCSTRIRINA